MGPAGTKTHGQMPERERADQEARDDLVADAEAQRRVEHVVRQRDGGRQRDHVAAEQRQLHPGLALRDAVAHRRHAARELAPRRPRPRSARLDRRRIASRTAGAPTACRCRPRRCRCSATASAQRALVLRRARGDGVRKIPARELVARRARGASIRRAREKRAPRLLAARSNSRRDLGEPRTQRRSVRFGSRHAQGVSRVEAIALHPAGPHT